MTLSKWLMQPQLTQGLTGLLALAFCLVAAKQNTMELRCHPSYGLVPSDGLASGAEFRACTRQTCHTDSLKIENGVALPSGPINIGSSVSISCNAGYQLDSAAAGGSAAPKCREHCGFDSPLKCKRIQCQISNRGRRQTDLCWQLLRLSASRKPDVCPHTCLLYTSPSPRDVEESRMPSSA